MESRNNGVVPLPSPLIWLIAFGFYVLTLAPSMGLGDVALLVESMFEVRLSTHVNNHPLTVFLGSLFLHLPFSDFTFRVNLLSALGGSIAVWIFYTLAIHACQNRSAAIIGTTALLLSHSLWWHSTIIENYCFNAIATTSFIWSCVQLQKNREMKYIYLLFFIAALSVFNHIQMSFLGIAATGALIIEFFRNPRQRRARLVCGSIIAFCIGFLPWCLLFIYEWRQIGSFSETLNQALFGSFQHIMLRGDIDGLKETLFLAAFQTPSLYLFFVATGVFFFLARWRFSAGLVAILIELCLNTYFFAYYNTWDRFAFLLPTFIILIFFGLFSLDSIISILRKQNPKTATILSLLVLLSLIPTPVFYGSLSSLGENPESFWHSRFNNTHSQNTHRSHEYIANPNKRLYTDVDDYLNSLFANLPPDSIYIDTDSRLFYPAKVYQRYYGIRPDVLITMRNSWNIPDWGLSEKAFLTMLANAYNTDAPLFLPSTGWPFEQIIARSKFKFRKVFLSNSTYIFRLITRKEELQTTLPEPSNAISLVAAVPANIEMYNLIFDYYISFVPQDMSGFEGSWYGDDQILIHANVEGAFVEFLVQTEAMTNATLTIGYTKAPNFGTVRIKLDQQILVDSINLYAPSVSPGSVTSKEISLDAGYHRLRVEFIDEPLPANRTRAGLDYVMVTPE